MLLLTPISKFNRDDRRGHWARSNSNRIAGPLVPLKPVDERFLRYCRLFAPLDENAFSLPTRNHRVVELATGQPPFEQDSRAEAFFVVLEGCVVLYRDQDNGNRVVIHLFGPGGSCRGAAIGRRSGLLREHRGCIAFAGRAIRHTDLPPANVVSRQDAATSSSATCAGWTISLPRGMAEVSSERLRPCVHNRFAQAGD